MSRRFVVHEISGFRMSDRSPTADRSGTQPLTTEIAVHDSWYGYVIVANYPSPKTNVQRLDERRTLAREKAARLNRDFG